MNLSNMFPEAAPLQELQLFEPDPAAVYSLEAVAQLVHVPRRTILIYCKHGLLSPAGGYSFNAEAIRVLRRIQSLCAVCGDDLAGIRMILDLTDEVHRLRAVMSALRASNGEAAEAQIALLAS
jgi:DNA-binding transcriptional MerR regulator